MAPRYCRRSRTSGLTENNPCHGHTELIKDGRSSPKLRSVTSFICPALPMMNGSSSYLRPSELLTLQAIDLVPPQTCDDSRLRYWGLLLCPIERNVSSKTLAFDARFTLDDLGRSMDRTWPFDQIACTKTFHGRWRADGSVQRYKKETRALQRIAMLDPATVANGQTVGNSLPVLFAQPTFYSHAARRRSLQTAFKQCLRSATQHRAFLDLSASGRGRTWWARRRLAALRVPLTELSHPPIPLLAGWMEARMTLGILFAC